MVMTTMRSGRVVCEACGTEADYHAGSSLDNVYRNGGRLTEDRESGRDLVTEMAMLSSRPDWLAGELRSMGVTPDGDEVQDD